MYQTCPATGRLSHRFDPSTHQCACGRWQRGFAPKRAPRPDELPRSECQLCEGVQALNKNGRLVLHGYNRPGHGWIVGRCWGTGREPFPARDALEEYLPHLLERESWLGEHRADTALARTLVYRYHNGWDYSGADDSQLVVQLRAGDRSRYDAEHHASIPGFEEHRQRLLAEIESEQRELDAEIRRVRARIALSTEWLG